MSQCMHYSLLFLSGLVRVLWQTSYIFWDNSLGPKSINQSERVLSPMQEVALNSYKHANRFIRRAQCALTSTRTMYMRCNNVKLMKVTFHLLALPWISPSYTLCHSAASLASAAISLTSTLLPASSCPQYQHFLFYPIMTPSLFVLTPSSA